MSNQQLTPGQRAMSVTFNPGGREDVNAIKQAYADTYDTIDKWSAVALGAIESDHNITILEKTERSSEVRRNQAIAKTQLEISQMLAVKAITR